MPKYHDATIRVMLNGFIVKVGCQEVVAENPESLLKLIKEYLKDPEKAEKELTKNSYKRDEGTGSATPLATLGPVYGGKWPDILSGGTDSGASSKSDVR